MNDFNENHQYDDDENDANKEFKRLLCEKIKAHDPIWKMKRFKSQKFFKEPYLNIINEISGKHFLLIKLFKRNDFSNLNFCF